MTDNSVATKLFTDALLAPNFGLSKPPKIAPAITTSQNFSRSLFVSAVSSGAGPSASALVLEGLRRKRRSRGSHHATMTS